MAKDYIEKRGVGYYLIGSRISDYDRYGFLGGFSAEGILESYPTLTLEQIHGSLAFYLANRKEIDAYFVEGEREAEKMREISRAENPLLYRRLEQAKRELNAQKQK